jgi:hypothetical protein
LNRRSSLFNCVLPDEISPSKCAHASARRTAAALEQSKLMALRKLSESDTGEIYLANYLLEQQTQCVLIKAIKTMCIDTAR